MAFWGVVLKPKKLFKLKFSDFQAPRLHLSQATLVSRRSEDRTIVKCRSGDSPFIYFCSFLPGGVETCSLDLFFDDDVTFCVKGPSSVHLAGYFDGVFDGNESGEDVEDDGYSEEEENNCDSMDEFLVKEGEESPFDEDEDDQEDDDDWFSDDDEIRVANTGVTIEELPDDTETPEKSIVPVRKLLKDSKHSEEHGPANVDQVAGKKVKESKLSEEHGPASVDKVAGKKVKDTKHSEEGEPVDVDKVAGKNVNDSKLSKEQGPADVDKMAGKKGAQHQVNGIDCALDQSNQASSSEDEDGFPLSRKRKQAEVASEQPSKKEQRVAAGEESSKKESANTLPQDTLTEGEPEADAGTKESTKKKKRRKKKKAKDSSEDPRKSIINEANGTLSKKKHRSEVGKEDSQSVSTSNEGNHIKKGSNRKYPNGLEVENVKMGKPDGKQATPGKKIGMIYTGRLRSNEKIFDSNVGKKPFFFRLGVGEVIKGWDIGVNGMRVGDKRRLIVPPEMGYGYKGVPGIPPNSWLKFDVELAEVK